MAFSVLQLRQGFHLTYNLLGVIKGSLLDLFWIYCFSTVGKKSDVEKNEGAHWASLVAQMAKKLPAMWETWLWSLGQEAIPWRREWQPTPVFFPGASHGQKTLAGYRPWGHRVGHDWAANTVKAPISYTCILQELTGRSVVLHTGHMMQGYEYMVVGCRQLFKRKKKQYSKLGSGGLVVKLCLTLCNPVDRSLPGLEKTVSYISGDRD